MLELERLLVLLGLQLLPLHIPVQRQPERTRSGCVPAGWERCTLPGGLRPWPRQLTGSGAGSHGEGGAFFCPGTVFTLVASVGSPRSPKSLVWADHLVLTCQKYSQPQVWRTPVWEKSHLWGGLAGFGAWSQQQHGGRNERRNKGEIFSLPHKITHLPLGPTG